MTRAYGDKDLTPQDYLQVSQIANIHNFIPETEAQTSLVHPDISPEAMVLKLDCYTKLSDEAKEVINVVTNRPITFVKFAWNNDPWFASRQLSKEERRIKKKPSTSWPRRLPRRAGKLLENRLTNLAVIKLFFKYRWKKEPEFVEGVMSEISSFVEVL